MKSRSIVILIVIVAIVSGLAFSAIYGVNVGGTQYKNAKESIELGLDLAGGVYVVLEAKTDATGEELQKMMEETKAIIGLRVDGLGVSEPNIAIEDEDRIRIELAGLSDPQEAIELIGKTALLEFKTPSGETVITGKHIRNAGVIMNPSQFGGEEPVVNLEFNQEGVELFRTATAALAAEENDMDKILYIVLDGTVISSPIVDEAINDGRAIITGGFTIETAGNLATLISAGALPVEMIEMQTSVIGPTLGLEAYERSIMAAGIALLLIFAFMISVYRVPGAVASLALIVYVLLVAGGMMGVGVKLTLPGIAGLVLSIGMAVDANILIFERIREEIGVGKSIRVSIDSGFKRALTSILDANITTLIAGLVLYNFGTGPIKGFGVTLIIGIGASMITALFFTKYVLRLVAHITGGKNVKLYGA
ncbi:protein translocase subunit SecD [Gudongella sp. DL1XJH-153]|uniref:protein translocase subunit SecD n=1 Tax=Gudongella sp. DL1XJH-153 TaxID=3409804 RepID=UPI003BB569BE